MKAELKRFVICPDCGKDISDHDQGKFAGAEEREKASINSRRDWPNADFRNWLVGKRNEYFDKVEKLHRDIDSPVVTINHNGLMLLNVWYHYIDIYDQEIAALKKTSSVKQDEFIINNIEIQKLVKELEKRAYFDKQYSNAVLNWFKGITPDKPIAMNCSANYFISIIADLKDSKFIKNSKKFCYSYISNSFLFKGSKPEPSYIEKVMKLNNVDNRVSHIDKIIPDIQQFKTSI